MSTKRKQRIVTTDKPISSMPDVVEDPRDAERLADMPQPVEQKLYRFRGRGMRVVKVGTDTTTEEKNGEFITTVKTRKVGVSFDADNDYIYSTTREDVAKAVRDLGYQEI